MKFIHFLAVGLVILPLSACNGGLQNTLNAHPAPRPASATSSPTMAASVGLSLSSPVNVTAPATYALSVSMKDKTGTVIPVGTVLANPIVFSSNNSATVGFGLTSGASASAITMAIA
jgi:hypothetical protein